MRTEKQQIANELFQKVDSSNAMILTDYLGLTSGKANELRGQLREKSVEYRVVRNRLFLRALKQAGIEGLGDRLNGSTAVLFVKGDQADAAKTLVKFIKTNEFPKIKAGIIGKDVLPKEKVEFLATLPSREVMLATLLRQMQSPVYGLVNVLAGIEKKLLYALNAIIEKKGKEAN
ncbi:50S ribosomal protein L10 [Candidatus Auribacterota bacterium]